MTTGGSPVTSSALSGPPGGEWLRVDGGSHGGRLYCALCKSFHERGWRYYVGLVARLSVCDECAKEAK